jgi:hypothetical protein
VYDGKAAVIGLFEQGFLGHFNILNPLVNLRQVFSNSINGVPRVLDFNDEAFVLLPQFGSQYFRVPVIHDFLFEAGSCRITQMHLYWPPETKK